jgi:hypothetical protein
MNIINFAEEQDEFVTAQAGNRIAGAYTKFQALGNFDQHIIADGMAVFVIDRLEAVEIEIANRQHCPVAFGLRHRQLQAVGEQHAVGQLGQRIEMRQVFEALLVLLDQRDVGEDGDKVGDFVACGCAPWKWSEQFDKDFTGFFAVPYLATPIACLTDGWPTFRGRSRHRGGRT